MCEPWKYAVSIDIAKTGISLDPSLEPPSPRGSTVSDVRCVNNQYFVEPLDREPVAANRIQRPLELYKIVVLRPDLFRVVYESGEYVPSCHIWVHEERFHAEIERAGCLRRELELVSVFLREASLLYKLDGAAASAPPGLGLIDDPALSPAQMKACAEMEALERRVCAGEHAVELSTGLTLTSEYSVDLVGRRLVRRCPVDRLRCRGGVLMDQGKTGKKATVAAVIRRRPCKTLLLTSPLRRERWRQVLGDTLDGVTALTYEEMLWWSHSPGGAERAAVAAAANPARMAQHLQDIESRRPGTMNTPWCRQWGRVVLDCVLEADTPHVGLPLRCRGALLCLRAQVVWVVSPVCELRSHQVEFAGRVLCTESMPLTHPLGAHRVVQKCAVFQRHGAPRENLPVCVTHRVRLSADEKQSYLRSASTRQKAMVCLGARGNVMGIAQRMRPVDSADEAVKLRRRCGANLVRGLKRSLERLGGASAAAADPRAAGAAGRKRARLSLRIDRERRQLGFFEKQAPAAAAGGCSICAAAPGDGDTEHPPVLLRCGHSLCLQCVCRCARSKSFDCAGLRHCPMCRTPLHNSNMYMVGGLASGRSLHRDIYGSKIVELSRVVREARERGRTRILVYLGVAMDPRPVQRALQQLGASAVRALAGDDDEQGEALRAFQQDGGVLLVLHTNATGLHLPAQAVIFAGGIWPSRGAIKSLVLRASMGGGAMSECHQLICRNTLEELFPLSPAEGAA